MNDFELSVFQALTDAGQLVLRDGWPDFLVLDKGGRSGYGLELKRGPDRLSPQQEAMHRSLALFGMQVVVARPEDVLDLANEKGSPYPTPSVSFSAADRLLSVVEAAEVLGIGKTTATELVLTGKLRSLKVGRRRLVPQSAIAEFVQSASKRRRSA